MELAFLIGRILFGGYWLMSGINHFKMRKMLEGYTASKGIPMPSLVVSLSGIILMLIGLSVILGIYVEWTLLILAIFLAAVSVFMHNFWTITDPNAKMTDMIHFMKNMALLGAALMMYMIPVPWFYSIGM